VHRWLAPLALVIVLVIHYSFYTLLGVPLPWGLLEPLAW
jgi:putative tricarboxylic transport membrane protein